MTPDELTLLQDTLQALKDSGLLDQLLQTSSEPGGQTALIYSLIGLVLMLGFRVIVVDRITRNIVQFHQDRLRFKQEMEKDLSQGLTIFGRVEGFLESISERLVKIQAGQKALYKAYLERGKST